MSKDLLVPSPCLSNAPQNYLGFTRRRRRRTGFTLVELLVTTVVTLILILAVSQTFALIGETVATGRATIEIAGSLRAVANRLQEDLDGVTVSVRPWTAEGAGQGYFLVYDGPSTDKAWNATGPFHQLHADVVASTDTIYGDIDDVVAFTARSTSTPFIGRDLDGNVIQARTAEIIWWIQYQDLNENGMMDLSEPLTIHRRVLLIRPDLPSTASAWTGTLTDSATQTAGEQLSAMLNDMDISARVNWQNNGGSIDYIITANSLADLTRPENRFAHWGTAFPHAINLDRTSITSLYRLAKSGSNQGEDVMTANAVAFDVRVFDPNAPLYGNAGEALAPTDPGWLPAIAAGASPVGTGAFVDLGFGSRPPAALANLSTFSGLPAARSGMNSIAASPFYCYDTWSMHFERDGQDQDGIAGADQGTNGLDDPNASGSYVNGVDDATERETSPPYPFPLRGVQIAIRVYEPDSRQLRQATVVTDFVPE
jgi:Tfp pilus assembly protein FimT